MARYTGPKHRLARLEGVNILEKTSNSLERRLNIIPGIHGKKGRRKTSEYGLQLREKQKLKKIYGLLEKQFRNYVDLAQSKKANTEDALVQLLETRLDNVVYRLGFAKSRNQARQMVSHKHVFVNGKKVNIPSYRVKEGDAITFSAKMIKPAEEEMRAVLPFVEREADSGKLARLPESKDVPNPVDYQLVIEFYSR
ncbi:MAG: 30S ribosomal protein S4 [Candidatus Levybacteria bacterium]|nr:30S ribosomal protein S4 [Candidatus Levybacteria bacterium]MBP9814884.1 30S ribosomal protein S4 [Candidatus Levybacteria bacterium]